MAGGKITITREETDALTRKFTILTTVFIALFIFGTLLVLAMKKFTLIDAVVYNLEALAFMVHEPAGFLKAFQIFMSIIGGFLIWWVLWNLFDLVFDDSFMDYLTDVKIHERLKHMKNHYVIVGGGKVGDELANRLASEQKQFVIIEPDPERVKSLKGEKFTVIKGDPTDIDVLRKVKLQDAKVLFIASHNTEKNLLIALLAKEINPHLNILARADNANVMNILEKAGVRKVVIPEIAIVDQFMIDLDATEQDNRAMKKEIENIVKDAKTVDVLK